jgi:hypothetical protein
MSLETLLGFCLSKPINLAVIDCAALLRFLRMKYLSTLYHFASPAVVMHFKH